MSFAHPPGEPIDYSPSDTESGTALRITRAWTTEDGWLKGV
jgi:hypothetical protein